MLTLLSSHFLLFVRLRPFSFCLKMSQQRAFRAECERKPFRAFVVSNPTSMPRISIQHTRLTNVSVHRKQATNRLLSPSNIPDVRSQQPGLKERRGFSLTGVSWSSVLLRAGLTACGPCLCAKDSNMVILLNIKTR